MQLADGLTCHVVGFTNRWKSSVDIFLWKYFEHLSLITNVLLFYFYFYLYFFISLKVIEVLSINFSRF